MSAGTRKTAQSEPGIQSWTESASYRIIPTFHPHFEDDGDLLHQKHTPTSSRKSSNARLSRRLTEVSASGTFKPLIRLIAGPLDLLHNKDGCKTGRLHPQAAASCRMFSS